MRFGSFFLLICISVLISNTASAVEKVTLTATKDSYLSTNTSDIKIFTEIINPITGQSLSLSGYPDGKKKKEYLHLQEMIKKILINSGKFRHNIKLILIDFPFFYYSQQEKASLDKYILDTDYKKGEYYNTPWIKVLLQKDENQIPSGVITILLSPFAQIRDLFQQNQNGIDIVPTENFHPMTDFSVSYDLYKEVIKLYENEFLNGHFSNTPENLQKIFGRSHINKQVLAKLCAISWQSTLGAFEMEVNNKLQQCLSKAYPYYLDLYEKTLLEIFSGEYPKEQKYTNHNCFAK